MAHVVLEKQNGNVAAAQAFARRQRNAARSDVLSRFWQEVDEAVVRIAQTGRKPVGERKVLQTS